MRRVVVLSGAIASGKTSLGDLLESNHSFERIKTRELIAEQQRVATQRGLLQEAGDDLDRATGGKWVADALYEKTRSLPPDTDVVVDAVRIEPQITALRERFGSRITHVHLTAPLDVLTERYRSRGNPSMEFGSYEAARANQTESKIEKLADIADIVIDTQRNTEADVEIRVACHLGLYGRAVERLVDVLVGGQYGSEGKGQVSACLAREYDVLVRVGGPNAGHKVYGEPPYTFHLLPSGTRASKAHLVLGPGAVLSVATLLKEIGECRVTPERLSIDPMAMIIDEADVAFEKKALEGAIGSTAQGVGAATSRKVLRTAASPAVRLAWEVEPRPQDHYRLPHVPDPSHQPRRQLGSDRQRARVGRDLATFRYRTRGTREPREDLDDKSPTAGRRVRLGALAPRRVAQWPERYRADLRRLPQRPQPGGPPLRAVDRRNDPVRRGDRAGVASVGLADCHPLPRP